ncbi:hypothetical protein JCM11251_003167 [Rhodosporidiobolus azoricus]
MDEIRKIPPFTRTVIGGIILATGSTLLHLLNPYHLAFIPHRIAAKWEVQRLVLPFLFGGRGLPLVFNLIMMYRSLVDLEQSHFGGRLAEMTWAFVIMCGGIIAANTPLQTPFLFNPFLMAVIHLWGQTNPTNRVSLYGIVNIPAPYFSFAMLGMELLNEGLDLLNGGRPAVLVSFTGMVVAHAYYFLSTILPRQNGGRQSPLVASLLTPPAFLVRQLGNGAAAPPSQASGFRTFGGGQRLGGSGGSGRSFFGGNSAPTAQAGTAGGASGSSAVRQPGGAAQTEAAWPGRGNRLGGTGL